jgi:hypothetical protein
MYDQKKCEGFTDKQIAQEILVDALNLALTEDHPRIETDLQIIENDYNKSKMRRVKKHLAKMAHAIFIKYGHTNHLDMSGSPIIERFDEAGL